MPDLDNPNFAQPPAWSLSVGEMGRALVYLAVACFVVAGIAWILSPRAKALSKVGAWCLNAGSLSLIGTFGCLAYLFVNNRFEFEYVFNHADTRNATMYRVAGIWSGQEGSFLLWATCASVFALLTAGRTHAYRRWFSIAYAVFLGALSSILAFESPFKLIMVDGKPFMPLEGAGLAPSLQNYWVVIHPPTIFLGFGSLTVLFALAFAALAERDFDSWIPIVRPWAIVSLTLVGLGLCMGGFWAYETLGWGGFWMWDPVENVSFVPWCFAIAFSHGILVQAARGKWKIANTLLAAFPFLVFVYGTFLTRSGFLSDASVHSFAEMDSSALKLLIGVMALTTLGFTSLFVFRSIQARRARVAEPDEKGLHREGFYFYGVWGLAVMGIATMVGMSVPLLMALQGKKAATVPEALYHQVLPWIFIPIMLLMAATPFVGWRRTSAKEFWGKLYTVLCVTIGIMGILLVLTLMTTAKEIVDLRPEMTLLGRKIENGLPWMLFLTGICVFTLVANFWRGMELWRKSKMGVGGFLAHVGIAVLMVGLVVSRGFEQKADTMVSPGENGRAMNYEFVYKGMTSNEGDRNNRLILDVYRVEPHAHVDSNGQVPASKKIFTAEPGIYKVMMGEQENTMVWPFILRGPLHDVYISLGQPSKPTSDDFTLKPGQVKQMANYTIKYKEMTMDGQPGQMGTKFGALVEVTVGDSTKTVHPQIGLGSNPGGMDQFPALIGDNIEIAMASMNAADKSVTLHLQMATPSYPVQVFHKPLTSFVWLGTGIMTLAGIMAARYRSPKKAKADEEAKVPGNVIPKPA